MSGAIQIVTRVGEPGSVRSEATVEGARTSPLGGNRRVTFESEGGTDLLRYSAGLGVAYDRGIYRLPNDLRSNDASVRLDVVPGGGFEVAAIARYMGVNFMLPVRDPGVTRMPLDPDQRNGRDRVVGSLEGTWTPSARWTHKLTLADYHLVFTYDNQDDKLDPSKYPFGFFDANYHYHAVLERLTGRYVGTVTGEPTPSLGFSFSYGGAWERESLHNDASGDFGPSTQAIGRSSIAAFGEGQLRVGDRLSFLTGARAESFHGVGGALVPRVTAVFQVIPGRVALRTAAATGYLAPNIQVQYSDPGFFIGNPDLKPEKSRSVEIGADFTGAFANASLTAFRQHYYNLIRIVPFDSTRQINRNLGSSRALGIEAEGAIHPRGQWVVGAEAAWTTTKMLDNTGLATDIYPDGQPLPFRPTYTASGYTTFPVFSPLSMTLRLSGVGPQIVLSERFSGARVSVAPYQTLGATATWPVSRTLDVYLHAENVLNSTYATAFDKPGAPRSVAAGIRIRQ
jgi:outer membrane receptor protein involved in Fe transport